MGSTLIIAFREGVEAFLIVAIALAYLRQSGRAGMIPALYAGVAAGIAASVWLGVEVQAVAGSPLLSGLLALVAAALVGSMVVYMRRMARHLRRHIGEKLEAASSRSGFAAQLGVFLFVLLMIGREGMETALMLSSLLAQEEGRSLALGGFLGVAAAALVAWAWSRLGSRVNLAGFFRVTSLFLAVFAVQLVFYAFHEFTEVDLLPIDNAYWHVATEDLAEGLLAQIFTSGLAFATVGWLVLEGWRQTALSRAARS